MKNLFLFAAVAMLAACAPQVQPNQINDSEVSTTGVIGGKEVSATSNIGRSTVGIYEKSIGYICTGTLIAKNLVLTAAHCVDPKAKDIRIIFATEMKKAKPEQTRRVNGSIVHPNYSQQMVEKDMNDMAILRFEGEAPAGFKIAPMLFDSRVLQSNMSTIVAGYGLNWATLISRGAGTLRTTQLKVDKAEYSQTEAMLGQSIRRGICSGDSGGPAYLEINGELHVWGVASRGDSIPLFFLPKCMLFSVYTRVDAFQNWIQDSMRALEY